MHSRSWGILAADPPVRKHVWMLQGDGVRCAICGDEMHMDDIDWSRRFDLRCDGRPPEPIRQKEEV